MTNNHPLYQPLPDFLASCWIGNEKLDGLQAVVLALAEGSRTLGAKIRGGMLEDVIGSTGEVNVQGEIVQKLDALASDTFVDKLSTCGRVAAIGSEEIAETVIVGDDPEHQYLVQMDPLDGSSNIDVAVSIGSIFGVWKRKGKEPVDDAAMLKSGDEQVAALYTVYGSCTKLVLATADNVQGFTLDPRDRVFRLTNPDIRFPGENTYYSTNEGNFKNWDEGTQNAICSLRREYSLRYVGCLVTDFHRNLLKGGIFLYPGTPKNPEGKLRLMYEANPLGFIAEQAGGAASSGTQRILDIQPQDLHQRTPLIVGKREVVEQTVSIIQGG